MAAGAASSACEDDRAVHIGNRRIGFSAAATPDAVPWGDLGCDIVLECTGKFLKPAQLDGYFARGVKHVIVAAPVKEAAALNIVVGVNDDRYEPSRHRLLTAASCTTNCLAPVVKVLHEAIGIRHGQITTIHDPTNTNVVVDAPHKDLRRARSAMLSLSPTTTGSATAIGSHLSRAAGQARRPRGARPGAERHLTDCVFEMARPVDRGGGERAVPCPRPPVHWQASLASRTGRWYRPTTPTTPAARSSTAPSTLVTDETLLKVYAWYDNEVGLCLPHGRSGQHRDGSGRLSAAARNYAIVTAATSCSRVTDGAIRMLVLLHFYQLGYTPFMLAFLFLLYETAGIFANVGGGWLASRFGIPRMLATGTRLSRSAASSCCRRSIRVGARRLRWPGSWRRRASPGVAKDLTKTASKSAIKATSQDGAGSCSAGSRGSPAPRTRRRAAGFFVGGLLLQSVGFAPALWLMAAMLAARARGRAAVAAAHARARRRRRRLFASSSPRRAPST